MLETETASLIYMFKGAYLCGFMFMLAACSNNLGKSDGSSSTRQGGSAEFEGASASLELWRRGPTLDGANLSLNSQSNLDNIARTPVPIYDLPDLSGPLRGTYLTVFESESNPRSTSVSDWQGKFVPWRNNPDFKMLMTFAHLSRAKRHVQTLFADVPFSTSGLNIDRLDAFASEPGDPLATGYNAGNGEGVFVFYSNDDPSAPYAAADEADAIYHEFGHALQHALNKGILESQVGVNADMDTLLEGLSDVFAAALVRDDHILSYLNSNSPMFFDDARTGPTHNRSMRHALSFPQSYVNHLHLDGRIVAGAINDLRKILMGETVSLQNCTGNCQVKFTSARLSPEEAWDLALRISYMPLQKLVPSSSLQRYAERLYQQVAEGDEARTAICRSNASCVNELKSDLSLILQSRGLLSWNGYPRFTDAINLPGQGGTPDLRAYTVPAFVPVGSNSDSDGDIEPCETVVLLPNFKNNTDESTQQANFYDIEVTLLSISGFTDIPSGSGVAESVVGRVGGNSRTKVLGWMAPGDYSWTLARTSSSKWFEERPAVGSQLEEFPTASTVPNAVGWAVRAPASGTASARFRIKLRVYNARYYDDAFSDFTVTQSVTIPTNKSNFCN